MPDRVQPLDCERVAFSDRLDHGEQIGMMTIDPSGSLKVLTGLTAETQNPDNVHCILIQHVLPTVVKYAELVNTVYPVDLVVAICYSADPATVRVLEGKGFKVLVPPSIDYMKQELWQDIARIVAAAPYPVMVQEVGGYMSAWTHELGKVPNFKGCVEDTKNGLWAYQAAGKESGLGVSVISMADTQLKRVEDSLIGDACVYSLEKVLRSQMAAILDGVRCGVIGWGNIGKSCAAALAGRNAVVSVYDINPVVTMLAYGRGLYPMPLKQLLQESDVIMGASGRRSVRGDDLHDINNGAILVSASSKDTEFDLVAFATECDIADITPPEAGACPLERYTVRSTGKFFYVLKHGTPIDFQDLPLSGSILDCTYSELFVCMRELASNHHAPGVLELPDSFQVDVAQRWLPAYIRTYAQSDDQTDKAFSYPASWDWT